MKITGLIDKDNGGLGYVNAILMSTLYNISAPINFYIDTGCSITNIGQIDALRIGIPYTSLYRSSKKVITANGAVFPHILPYSGIMFVSGGTSLLEYVGNIHVMAFDQSVNRISLLGLDVLKNFSIKYKNDKIILER